MSRLLGRVSASISVMGEDIKGSFAIYPSLPGLQIPGGTAERNGSREHLT